MSTSTICTLFFLALFIVATDAISPPCSLSYCVTKGARALCTFKSKVIKCKKWARVDPNACPKIVCAVACPNLPAKGPVCRDICPACRFPFESCKRKFKLFRPTPEECKKLPPSPSPIPKCSLQFCSRNGNRAKCILNGKVIKCGRWPRLEKDVCPKFICLILCDIPAKTGPVCTSCPDCAFLASSCATNFKLYRAKNCPPKSLTS